MIATRAARARRFAEKDGQPATGSWRYGGLPIPSGPTGHVCGEELVLAEPGTPVRNAVLPVFFEELWLTAQRSPTGSWYTPACRIEFGRRGDFPASSGAVPRLKAAPGRGRAFAFSSAKARPLSLFVISRGVTSSGGRAVRRLAGSGFPRPAKLGHGSRTPGASHRARRASGVHAAGAAAGRRGRGARRSRGPTRARRLSSSRR